MKRAILFSAAFSVLLCEGVAQERGDANRMKAALERVSPDVGGPEVRERLRSQLQRALREEIAEANRASSAEWAKIDSREAWERFRREKIDALRKSLGDLPSRAAKPRALVTGTIEGEGFRIENVVYESRPGLVVAANLYVPQPGREKMPAIVVAHSHHNAKEQGELQDMGMTWARAGCYVLVPDALGHGERRQHPFVTSGDYHRDFQVGRQDYYFRYDTSLQLYLAGESLMGWMAHDLMTGIDLLLAQPGIDSQKIILLGSVAGGGDPAALTAALDERIACVVPFNFGGPQPETRYPLPDDAETAFNYSGGGSWESTRNLRRSAADGFLPWNIVASVAPRYLIHAHEFTWDQERDPVWKRYQQIWGFYGETDRLAFTQGFGVIQVTDKPASHCNNVGAVHRKQIHEAFGRWFGIDVKPDGEYSHRRSREELTCLTEAARRQFQPKPLSEIVAALADQRLAAARTELRSASAINRRRLVLESWARVLGNNVERPKEPNVKPGEPPAETIGGLTVRRELLETDPGIFIPVMTLSETKGDAKRDRSRPVALGFASDGIAGILKRRTKDLIEGLEAGAVVVLLEPRGTGATGQGNDHGQQSSIVSAAATTLMLGRTLLGDQLRDLRAVWRHVQRRMDVDPKTLVVAGGSGAVPLAANIDFSHPRRIDGRPRELEPSGVLLALLFGLFEDDALVIVGRNGLVSYRSVLDSQFVQAPLDCIIPGILREGDVPDLVAVLAPRDVALEALADGRGRLVPEAAAINIYLPVLRTYGEPAPDRLQIVDVAPAND